MSEEEQVELDIKSDQAKFKNKKKVRKRKSKTICEDEDDTGVVKVQPKSKKMKVETALNNSLLKWLNKSVDKSQTSSEVFQINSQESSMNKSTKGDCIGSIVVNPKTNVSNKETKLSSSLDSTNSNTKSNVDELLSKIDFSNLKAKLNAKLNLSPKSPTVNTQNLIESTVSSPIKNGCGKKNQPSLIKKKTNTDNKPSHTQNSAETENKINCSKNKDEGTIKSIPHVFEKVKPGKSEKLEEVNGKHSTMKEDSDNESDEHSQFFEDHFHDSDDSGMIFLSNKYERRKFVENESFVKTPVKETELMAPPYSPLSPLCKKSPRATRSPSLSSLRDSPLMTSPILMKSPQLSSSPWKKKSPLKSSKKSCKYLNLESTHGIMNDSALDLAQHCKDALCTAENEENPCTFKIDTPKVLSCEPLKEFILEKKEKNIVCKKSKETFTSKKSKIKIKSLEANDSIGTNSQSIAETSFNEYVSDEDFKTPKKKAKSEQKKKRNSDQPEKIPKDNKGKKKESPNLNSSLLNYFKRVEKDVEKSTEKVIPDGTDIHSPKTEPVHITTDDNINETDPVENCVEKKRHKKKNKKRRRSSCVEIRFDFESDASRDQEVEVESKKKQKDGKERKKSDKKKKILEQDAINETITDQSEVEIKKEKEVIQETIDRNKSKNLIEDEFIVEKNKKEHIKNEEIFEQQTGKERKEDFKLDIKQNKNNENLSLETDEMENCTKDQQNTLVDFDNECEEKEVPTKNEPEPKKKRSRGRPKKETIVKTFVNEPLREVEKSVKAEKIKDHDDKENLIRNQESKGRGKEKKELQEHCNNVDEKEIDGREEKKTEESASLFKYFQKVDSLVDQDKKSSSNVLRVEVQVHTPPSTPSKWKRKSLPNPVPPPTSTPDDSGIKATGSEEGRRKSSRISEKRQKEETRRKEDEIVVLEDEKEENKPSKCRTKISDDSDDDLFVVKEKKKSTLPHGPHAKVKLASIFVKKPKTSKLETEARQRFLQSGVPDAIRRQTELLRKQEEILEELECYSFPLINHVTQTLATLRAPGTNTGHPLDLGRFKLCPDSKEKLTLDDWGTKKGTMVTNGKSDWKSLMKLDKKEKIREEWTRPTNVTKALNVLKKRVPSIEECSVYRQIAGSLTSDQSKQRETEDSPLPLWSEKYKPESERDILGNRGSVDTLRCWLEARKKVQRRPLYTSSDEESDFMEDTNSSSQFSSKQNTVVLTGPAGCGKTCTVYALANQLGLKVIELNASCNRNGKRILSDLSEATQSHQVSHQSQAAGQLTNFFGAKLNGPALFGAKSASKFTTSPDVIDLFDSSLEGEVEVKPKRKRKRNDDRIEKEDSENSIKKNGKKGKSATGKEKKSLDNQKNDGKKTGKRGNGNSQDSVQNTSSVGKSFKSVGKNPTLSGKSAESEPSDREKDDGGKSMSIILIEDADIIFSDYDEGFVAALSSLIATSKRPLILVTNEERVGHLSKLMRSASSLVLHFETPLYAEIGCFLQLVSILEGIKLSQDRSLLLVHHNRGDIRKCLLALQFYVLSKSAYTTYLTDPPLCASSVSQLTSLWWLWSSHYNLPPLIYNHARTLLTQADQHLYDTHEITEIHNTKNNLTQTSGSEIVGNTHENRSSSIEDENFNEREATHQNHGPNNEIVDKVLLEGDVVSVKSNKDSQESGYASASSQQNQKFSEENQQLSQENQESCQPNQQTNSFLTVKSADLDSNVMGENLVALKDRFSRRFESWSQFQTEKSNMMQLSTILSCFSQVDLMHAKLNLVSPSRDSNPVPQLWQCSATASSSLDNDDVTSTMSCPHDVITADLCASLISCGRGLLPACDEPASSVNVPYEEMKRHTQQAFSLQRTLLSSFSPAESLSRRGFSLDCYTTLRTLARSEQARYATSTKRYNRFFNHLKSLNIHLSQSETERMCRILCLQ